MSVGLAALCVGSLSVLPLVAGRPASAAGYDPATDAYSMAAVAANTGATGWWNAGYTGKGVDVALIDTGVSPVPGLATPGKIINGPDLSLESRAPNLTHLDTNGHGTFMAGLIAGHDATLTAPYANAPASAYRGIAPDARIVALKVATADGGVDVSQVIAAINWVVDHKSDNGMNIRVLNLSYGTNSSPTGYGTDPLAFAVERAWKAGIVVVAAVGNDRYTNTGQPMAGLANPASDPFVLSVGASDTAGTATYSDDFAAAFSSKNNLGCSNAGCKNPDLVAPGAHLQGLRVVNGFIDANHPEGLIDGRYFRGSGTSQATAIASGAAALIVQKFPTATPDQIRKFLKANSKGLAGYGAQVVGSGELSLDAMVSKTPPSWANTATPSTGTGTLEAARGSDHLTRDGVTLTGEVDIFGHAFTPGTAGSSWTGGTWNGSAWSGSTWSGSTWSGSTWSGSSWSGSTWSGSSWSGSSWSGSSWSGSSWSGSSWSGSTWSGHTWADGSWS